LSTQTSPLLLSPPVEALAPTVVESTTAAAASAVADAQAAAASLRLVLAEAVVGAVVIDPS